MSATHSQFARFEDRVDETIDRQIARLETKLEPLQHVVRDLAVLSERQVAAAALDVRFDARITTMAERVDARLTSTAERVDERFADLAKLQQQLEAKVDRYVQRYVGVTVALGAGWAVASHFLKP